MPFQFTRLAIPDVILIEPKVFKDDRGFFAETYKTSEFKANGIDVNFVQDNYSISNTGVIRGLHFQCNPNAQGKLVRVVSGKVFDVAVDIRKGSPTYGKWVSTILSTENNAMIWIPSGFAHGVCILEDNTKLLYKVSGAEYTPQDERSIIWDDAKIGIDWPIKNPEVSVKDRVGKSLAEIDNNFVYTVS
ncbi:MAG: dTDP-4-dehydrorhamnose 3,5-epimerase [Gammaproteobacteria bacterium RIFCSPHIGHO2_12_FULL_40_19]|nr:MAG: dTDP-4-dehydrorhamnose 3,5-epimerase [Gammaproteobacteria bacterium RIFCSPHIGHO2_12_FULL_40_19]